MVLFFLLHVMIPYRSWEYQYLDLLQDIVDHWTIKTDRTWTWTKSLFGRQIRFNLQEGFPLLTTKKLHLKSIIHELLWFLKWDTNIGYLKNNGVSIRDERADQNGDLWPVYGKQWRKRETKENSYIDQIAELIKTVQTNPDSRRMIVNAWNVEDLSKMALTPCHALFQAYVSDQKLSVQLYQRSADVFLWVPFNIASYALLTMMIAQVCRLELGDFVHTFGDVHLYLNHQEQATTQLTRAPKPFPTMKINPHTSSIDDFHYDDFTLIDYNPHPAIKAPVAI